MSISIKKILIQLHLWIGLTLGVLFFVISFSGAIYTWETEISNIIYKKKVIPRDVPFVPISTLKATIDREFPKGDFRTAFYKDKSHTIQVLLYGQGTYYHAFMDPYTGALIHLQDMKKGWLNQLIFLHRNLMLGDLGQEIVHWGTLLFLIMIITGIVMWWPNNRAGVKQRLTIKWNVSPKRLNYNLHNVLGFYVTWILIFSVLTGLFWGFEIVSNSLRTITGENEMTYDLPKSELIYSNEHSDTFALLDSLMLKFRNSHPSSFIRISNPHEKSDPIHITVVDAKLRAHNVDHYYFDQYTGKPITGKFESGLYANASTFHTLNGLIYDIHLGTIFGLPGKVLVFLASLTAASLPITGFLIWFNKKRKKANKKP